MSDPFCNFYIGQRVAYKPANTHLLAAVLAHFARAGYALTMPEVGRVYHVRGMDWDSVSRRTGIFLREIVQPPFLFPDGLKEPAFWHCDFKPLTDISSLERFLKEVPLLIDELASDKWAKENVS